MCPVIVLSGCYMTDGISGENHMEYNEKEADRLGENTRTAGYIYAQRDSDRNS